jgi:O-antigen/teichoic acid export membrane protein
VRVRQSNAEDRAERASLQRGIWSPFRSMLTAQAVAALFGLVFWVLVARLVDASEVGVAAAAISAQTLLGLVTVLGLSTLLITELPLHTPARQRKLLLRALLVVSVSSVVVGSVVMALHPLLPGNLREALSDPLGGLTFILGVAAATAALVIDDSSLGLRRSNVQVGRNLLASSLRFPVTALLLVLGFTDAHVLQLCWVLPIIVSIPVATWRLGLPRGDRTSPSLRKDLVTYAGPALRNHGLSLWLSAASQMVPVIAGLTLSSVANAEFAIAWLMATFVFLPPYLLATALFAHGANVSSEEFRKNMERTIPASLLLSAGLLVGAWVLGEPVLRIFGGDYATESWRLLAVLAPAGLWMVFKDHLVALLRSQKQFSLATRLAGGALVIEMVGATAGGIVGGGVGLGIGWLLSMVVEAIVGLPWLRRAFGGLRWKAPIRLRRRAEAGKVAPHIVTTALVVLLVCGVGFWSATRPAAESGPSTGSQSGAQPGSQPGSQPAAAPVETCAPTAEQPGPLVDLGVQTATRDGQRTPQQVARLVRLAKQAGASVISTTASFRTTQPSPGEPYRFVTMDRTIAAAKAAGLQVRLRLVGMPRWALDEPSAGAGQAPRSPAELARWATFVRDVMRHVDGQVDYLEVWYHANQEKFWPTGPDPVEFVRLLLTTYPVVHEVSPATQVVSGGILGNDIGFLEKMYDAAATLDLGASPFDLLGVDPFSGARAPDEVDPSAEYSREPYGLYDESYTGFMRMHDVMADHGDAGLPIYLGSFGYSTRGYGQTPAVPDELRASYLTSALGVATCTGYVRAFSWYAFHTTRWDPVAWTLLDARERPNQTYEALVRWTQGSG